MVGQNNVIVLVWPSGAGCPDHRRIERLGEGARLYCFTDPFSEVPHLYTSHGGSAPIGQGPIDSTVQLFISKPDSDKPNAAYERYRAHYGRNGYCLRLLMAYLDRTGIDVLFLVLKEKPPIAKPMMAITMRTIPKIVAGFMD